MIITRANLSSSCKQYQIIVPSPKSLPDIIHMESLGFFQTNKILPRYVIKE